MGELGHTVGQGRGDAREMKPGLAPHDFIPVNIALLQLSDGAALAIVEKGGRPLRSARLHKIDAQPVAQAPDVVEVQAVLPHVVEARLADRRIGHRRDHVGRNAIVDERNAHVGLGPRVVHFKFPRLHNALVVFGRQAHH